MLYIHHSVGKIGDRSLQWVHCVVIYSYNIQRYRSLSLNFKYPEIRYGLRLLFRNAVCTKINKVFACVYIGNAKVVRGTCGLGKRFESPRSYQKFITIDYKLSHNVIQLYQYWTPPMGIFSENVQPLETPNRWTFPTFNNVFQSQ